MGGCGMRKRQSFDLQSSAGGRCLQLVLGLPLALAPRVPAALLGVQEPSPTPTSHPVGAGVVETARAFCTKLRLFQSPFQSSTGLESNHGDKGVLSLSQGAHLLPLRDVAVSWGVVSAPRPGGAGVCEPECCEIDGTKAGR